MAGSKLIKAITYNRNGDVLSADLVPFKLADMKRYCIAKFQDGRADEVRFAVKKEG